MKLLSVVTIFAVLGWSYSEGETLIELIPGYGTMTYYDTKGNMNEYLDKVLEEAKTNFAKFNIDPMKVPDFEHNIQRKVLFINLKGGVKISNGVARGLSSLHRAGDATLRMEDGTNKMIVDGSLGVNDVDISANVYAWFSFLKLNLKISGKATYLKATVDLELPLGGQGMEPKATRFVVDQVSGFKLKVTGLGIFNWLAEKIIGWYTGDITKFINNKLGQFALNAINSKIGSILSPKISL